MRKLSMMIAILILVFCAVSAQAHAASALSSGTLEAIDASPNQKLALRSGPGTNYSEIFSIAASSVEDFAIYQQEKGGSVMWGMVEFDSRYGRYRVYTGMKRIHTDAKAVPLGNKDGVMCAVGSAGAWAHYGPGQHYAQVDEQLPAWTEVIVYHEEQGWVMADFVLPGAKKDQYDKELRQLTRAWIPVWALSGYESAQTQENDPYGQWYELWENGDALEVG